MGILVETGMVLIDLDTGPKAGFAGSWASRKYCVGLELVFGPNLNIRNHLAQSAEIWVALLTIIHRIKGYFESFEAAVRWMELLCMLFAFPKLQGLGTACILAGGEVYCNVQSFSSQKHHEPLILVFLQVLIVVIMRRTLHERNDISTVHPSIVIQGIFSVQQQTNSNRLHPAAAHNPPRRRRTRVGYLGQVRVDD